jgi:hypothetical protein
VHTTRAGKAATIDVAANDGSPEGFHFVKVVGSNGQPSESGIVTGAGAQVDRQNGKIVYKPAKGFTGTDTFSYVVVDDDDDVSNPATVRVTVGNNAPPEIDPNGAVIHVREGKAAAGDLSERVPIDPNDASKGTRQLASDPDGDSLTYILRSNKEHVELKNDGQFVYTPNTVAGTEDSFTFVVSDGNSESNVGNVRVVIDAPDVSAQSQGDEPSSTTTTRAAALPILGLPALFGLLRRKRRSGRRRR